MLVCFYEAVFEADLSMGLWRPPKECTHECSQSSLLLLCRNWFLTGQTGFINFSNCKNRFNQQTSSSQSYFWIQPFKTVLASWAYYIVRMMLYNKQVQEYLTVEMLLHLKTLIFLLVFLSRCVQCCSWGQDKLWVCWNWRGSLLAEGMLLWQ